MHTPAMYAYNRTLVSALHKHREESSGKSVQVSCLSNCGDWTKKKIRKRSFTWRMRLASGAAVCGQPAVRAVLGFRSTFLHTWSHTCGQMGVSSRVETCESNEYGIRLHHQAG